MNITLDKTHADTRLLFTVCVALCMDDGNGTLAVIVLMCK